MKKTEPEKNPIKPIKILKKPADSVRFTSKKSKKPNRNEPKPVGLTRFRFFLFFLNFRFNYIFLIKTESNIK